MELLHTVLLLDFVPDQDRTFETFLLRVVQSLRAKGRRVIFVFAGDSSDRFAAALKASDSDWRVSNFPWRSVDHLTAELRANAPTVMVTSFSRASSLV